MSTLTQIIKKKRKPRKYKNKRPDLQKCPQKKATCLKVFNMTPRKPNSALRKVAWVLLSNFHRVHAYIPGMGHNTLQKHSIALDKRRSCQRSSWYEIYNYTRKIWFTTLHLRRKARSKYGGKKIYTRVDHRYRKYKYW